MEAIEAAARTLHAEAEGLMARTKLLPLLERFGKVNLTGSFTTGLMVWRDLDIELIAEDLSLQAFFRLGGELARVLRPARMHYRDEHIMNTPGLPRGRYSGTYLPGEDGWKIDLWVIGSEEHGRRSAYSLWLRENLTSEARGTILKIKSSVWRDPDYRRRYSSTDIYDAVINKGISEVAAFLSLVASRDET